MKVSIPTFKKPKIRRRQVKKAVLIAVYAFVAIVTVAGMVAPSLQF